MKIAAVVILYHPKDVYLLNIKSYHDAVNKVYVFDNTEQGISPNEELIKLTKIGYYYDGKNLGLATRLNEAANMAINDGFDWLLLMDQDSSFVDGSFAKYLDCFTIMRNKENVAMFGTTNSRKNITASVEDCQYREDNDLITSGTLLNLPLFKEIGNFDEALFIDSVDHDYCIRIKLAGYRIIRFSNISILHEIGEEVHRSSIKTLFLFKKKKEIHAPVRFYYMYRNMLYLSKKFEIQNLAQIKKIKKEVITRIINGIYYGRNSVEICKYLRKGYKDYKKMKMGKLEDHI